MNNPDIEHYLLPVPEIPPSIQRTAEVLMGAFAYDDVSVQLQWLMRKYYIYPCAADFPLFRMNTPSEASPDEIIGWEKNPNSWGQTTTSRYVPESPRINPESTSFAQAILTATRNHHYFGRRGGSDVSTDHDLLVIGELGGGTKPYWYNKGGTPIKPQPLISHQKILRLLMFEPQRYELSASLQLWHLTRDRKTYVLAAQLDVHSASLNDVVRVLTAPENLFLPPNPQKKYRE